MRRLSDRSVVHVEIISDGPHNNLTGIQSDPNLRLDAVVAQRSFGKDVRRSLHANGGIASAYRMVLKSNGGSEECHDSVAHHLVHCSLIMMDGLHHEVEHGIEDFPGFLGIALSNELHRSLHIGKQNSDELALTRERDFRREDARSGLRACVPFR
jgi:hypothetical protein